MTLKHTLAKSKMYELGLTLSIAMRVINDVRLPVLRDHGIDSSAEWFVLGLVSDHKDKGIRVTDLANLIGVNTTYITAVLNGLRDKGYVRTRSDKSDARVRLIVATAKGLREAAHMEEQIKDIFVQRVGDRITAEQADAYMHVLQVIAGRDARLPSEA